MCLLVHCKIFATCWTCAAATLPRDRAKDTNRGAAASMRERAYVHVYTCDIHIYIYTNVYFLLTGQTIVVVNGTSLVTSFGAIHSEVSHMHIYITREVRHIYIYICIYICISWEVSHVYIYIYRYLYIFIHTSANFLPGPKRKAQRPSRMTRSLERFWARDFQARGLHRGIKSESRRGAKRVSLGLGLKPKGKSAYQKSENYQPSTKTWTVLFSKHESAQCPFLKGKVPQKTYPNSCPFRSPSRFSPQLQSSHAFTRTMRMKAAGHPVWVRAAKASKIVTI